MQTIESVEIVFVYLSFQNIEIKVMGSSKSFDSFELNIQGIS
jgi:hypothetical protein